MLKRRESCRLVGRTFKAELINANASRRRGKEGALTVAAPVAVVGAVSSRQRLAAFARTRQDIQLRLHLGDSLQLNFKCGSKAGHLKRMLMKTRVELLKRRLRFHYRALGEML